MKRIAIVAGGDSSEHDVSLRSAQGIWSFLNHDKYETYIITIEGTDWKMVQYDGKEYAALIPVDESEDGDEVTILEAKRNADGEFDDMIGISDEAVLNAVFELFIKNYNEDED